MQLNNIRAHFRNEILEFFRQGITQEQMMLILQELKIEVAISMEYNKAVQMYQTGNDPSGT